MKRRTAFGVLLASLLALALGSAGGSAGAQSSEPVAVSLQLDGVVDPFVASFVESRIVQANRDGAPLVLLNIDTPGGLDSSMRKIVQAILNSEVPVVCYVSPPGARAASAGTFILLAGHVAAMAPGTNVGAAHPVGISGAIESEKVLNDAAAYIRSLAELRGRDADWAEQAVRASVSISAEQALALGVIDVIAPDEAGLLRDLDGRSVEVAGGRSVVLHTDGLAVEQRGMSLLPAILHTLLDPNIAFLFFWLGLAFIVLEFFVPGGVVGTLGAIMLILAVVALGMLPVQLVGVALLVASVVFFVVELKVAGHGISGAMGVITLILGGTFLYDSSVPSARVAPWMLALVAGVAALFFFVVVRAAIKMRRRRSMFSDRSMIGADGTVLQAIDPVGVAQVASEQWTVVSEGDVIPVGARIRVVGVDGLRLKVVPVVDPRETVTPVAGWGDHGGGTK